MARKPYNLTDDVSLLVHLLVRRVPALAHIRPGQLIHGISQARTRSRYGVYAQCHALRFRHGAREHKTRDGHAWQWPIVRVGGQEILYYITYFLPRFLDQPPHERLHTLLHELHHISPRFNGDLRRFPGRNTFHGAEFDASVERLVHASLPEIEPGRFPFLNLTFDELVARFGGVVGNRLKRFQPRKVRLEDLPTNQAVTPRHVRQMQLFPET